MIVTQCKYNTTIIKNKIEKERPKICPNKSTVIEFTRRKRGQEPLNLRGENVQLKGEVNYLVLTTDSNLNWIQ